MIPGEGGGGAMQSMLIDWRRSDKVGPKVCTKNILLRFRALISQGENGCSS